MCLPMTMDKGHMIDVKGGSNYLRLPVALQLESRLIIPSWVTTSFLKGPDSVYNILNFCAGTTVIDSDRIRVVTMAEQDNSAPIGLLNIHYSSKGPL